MFLVVRVWDAFADLAAGRLVDITRSRWGKFRPYLLFASLPLLLSSIALFSVPNFDSTTAKYIYAYVTYALLGFLYSLTNIPYGSLATAMTQDPVERSRLGIWRSVGPIFGILHPGRGDRSSDHPVQNPARSASDLPDHSDHRVRRRRVRPLPVLLLQLQGAGIPRDQAGDDQGDRRTPSGRTGRC